MTEQSLNLEEELAAALMEEVARELVLEDHEVIDETIFAQVMLAVTGGTNNPFDAPILYALLKACP